MEFTNEYKFIILKLGRVYRGLRSPSRLTTDSSLELEQHCFHVGGKDK